MDYDVTVHITPNTDGSFFVTGTTTGRRGGGLNKHDCPNAKALRGFLSGDLGIHKREADAAMVCEQGWERDLSYCARDADRRADQGARPRANLTRGASSTAGARAHQPQ